MRKSPAELAVEAAIEPGAKLFRQWVDALRRMDDPAAGRALAIVAQHPHEMLDAFFAGYLANAIER